MRTHMTSDALVILLHTGCANLERLDMPKRHVADDMFKRLYHSTFGPLKAGLNQLQSRHGRPVFQQLKVLTFGVDWQTSGDT